jgi:hypothetical protein
MPNLSTCLLFEKKTITILCLLTMQILFSQKIYEFNSSGSNCYSKYLFQENSASPKGVLVIDAEGRDLKTLSQNNIYVNSGLFIDYNILYINILDKESKNFLNCYNAIIYNICSIEKIRESVFFVISPSDDPTQTSIIYKNSSYPFSIINHRHENLELLKSELDAQLLDKSYRTDKLYSYEEIRSDKMGNYKDNFDAAFFYSPLVLFGPKLNSTSDVVLTKGLSFRKSLTSQSTLLFNLNIGNKKPNVDIQPNQKGTIHSFVLIGTELMYRYYDNPDKPLRFFASFGLGGYSMTNMKIKIKSSGPSIKSAISDYFTLIADAGLEYRISPMVKVSSSLPIKYFSNKTDKSASTLGMGINLGISATLNPNSKARGAEKKKNTVN